MRTGTRAGGPAGLTNLERAQQRRLAIEERKVLDERADHLRRQGQRDRELLDLDD